jgi:hypothetical protein
VRGSENQTRLLYHVHFQVFLPSWVNPSIQFWMQSSSSSIVIKFFCGRVCMLCFLCHEPCSNSAAGDKWVLWIIAMLTDQVPKADQNAPGGMPEARQ